MTAEFHRHPDFARYGRLLRAVAAPGRYAGGEFTAARPAVTDGTLRVVVAYPDLYEAACANPDRERVRARLSAVAGLCVERVCLPARDLEHALHAADLPLFSLETRTPLHAFDLVHFVIPEAALFVNVAAMLELGGIPARADARGDGPPLVIASGPPLSAPEAIAPLLDLVLVGEVEDTLAALAERWPVLRTAGLPVPEVALELGRTLDGAYVPAGYRPDDASPTRLVPATDGLAPHVRPARVHDLERVPLPVHPPVPGLRTAEAAIHLEVRRGVDRAAARAGDEAVAPAPVRHRSAACLLDAFETWFASTGLDTIVLDGDDPGAHPELDALLHGLRARLRDLPSRIRVPDLPLAAWRRHFAAGGPLVPGGGGRGAAAWLAIRETTPALARRQGQPVDPAALVAEAEALYRAGFDAIAGVAVVGVPGESEEDLTAIGRLARELCAARRVVDNRFARIEITVRPWIPRPHTDDERGAFLTEEAFAARLTAVRQAVGRRREVRVRAAPFDRARVEALCGRGDRHTAAALVAAARDGIRLYPESPAEPAEPIANRLLAATGTTHEEAHAAIPADAPLPWAHIRLED